MSCCGNQRSGMRATAGPRAQVGARPQRRYAHAFFRYVGATSITVQGPATGRLYRFARPGASVAVDPRDALSLARLPQLRQTAGP